MAQHSVSYHGPTRFWSTCTPTDPRCASNSPNGPLLAVEGDRVQRDECAAVAEGQDTHLLRHCARHVAERAGRNGIRLGDDDRPALVAAGAHVRLKRHLAQERHAVGLPDLLAAAAPEDLVL